MPDREDKDQQETRENLDIEPKVAEVYRELKRFMRHPARSKWLSRRKECWEAIENEMWSDKEKEALEKEGQVPLVINKCNKGVQGSCAIVTDQKPDLKYLPVGSSDLYVAELLKRAWDYVFTRCGGQDTVYAVVEEAKIGAIGFFDVKFDQNTGVLGRIDIEECPPDDLYWDADSKKRDLSDTAIIKAKRRSPEYIRENYDGIADTDMRYEEGMSADVEGGKSSGVDGEDNYTIEAENPDSSGEMERKKLKTVWEIEAWMLKTQTEHWVIDEKGSPSQLQLEEGDKPEQKAKDQGGQYWKRKVKRRVQRIIVGRKLISEEINPYGEDADGDPVFSLVPVPSQRTLTAYPMSPTAYAKEINREKNKRRAQFIHAASHLVNSPIVRIDKKSRWVGSPGTAGSELLIDQDIAHVPSRLGPGSIDIQKFVELEHLADQGIDDQYDLHDVMRGKVPPGQSNIAGRTVLALQDLGGMMSKPFLRSLESALVRVGKVVMSLILERWPAYMWDRLLEDDEMETLTPDGKITKEDEEENPDIRKQIAGKWKEAIKRIADDKIRLIDLDVKIVAGSSMPTNRIAKGQMAIEYLEAGMYDPEAALEYVDDPNKDKIVERLKQREQAEMQAAATKGK